MNHIISFSLPKTTSTKDATGQTTVTKVWKSRIGQQKSVYQNEFYKADQAGIRAQGIIEMSSFDYGGEASLIIGSQEFTIYRTREIGTDRIELYYGERVGNG